MRSARRQSTDRNPVLAALRASPAPPRGLLTSLSCCFLTHAPLKAPEWTELARRGTSHASQLGPSERRRNDTTISLVSRGYAVGFTCSCNRSGGLFALRFRTHGA